MDPTLDIFMTWEYPGVNEIPPEVRGKLWRILHDFECDDDNFTPFLPRVCELNAQGQPVAKLIKNPRTGKLEPYGLPEVESLINFGWETSTEEHQWFWFNLLEKNAPDTMSMATLKQRMADLVDGRKFVTNHHGPNNGYCDFINQVNMGKPGFGHQNTTTCGNVVVQAGATVMKGGKLCLPIYCLDRFSPPPEVEAVHNQPWFVHKATICRPERIDPTPTSLSPYGTYRVNPFPQLDGRDVPVPMYSKSGDTATVNGIKCRVNFIVMRRVIKIGDEIPSAYVR